MEFDKCPYLYGNCTNFKSRSHSKSESGLSDVRLSPNWVPNIFERTNFARAKMVHYQQRTFKFRRVPSISVRSGESSIYARECIS